MSLGFNLTGSLAAIDKWVQEDMESDEDEEEGGGEEEGEGGGGDEDEDEDRDELSTAKKRFELRKREVVSAMSSASSSRSNSGVSRASERTLGAASDLSWNGQEWTGKAITEVDGGEERADYQSMKARSESLLST
jgi:hypothetical protein